MVMDNVGLGTKQTNQTQRFTIIIRGLEYEIEINANNGRNQFVGYQFNS